MPRGYRIPSGTLCSVEDCNGPHYGRSLCNKHYQKWRTYGDPTYSIPLAKDAPCLIEGCDDLQIGRGWCARHYQRWRTHGSPTAGGPYQKAGIQWLREQVATRDRTEGCWEWPFGKSGSYGSVRYAGCQLAHQVALVLDGQPRPPAPSDFAIHSCDNPPCVNPAHLRWATPQENARDMVERTRQARGSHHSQAKLTEEQVLAIRSDPRPQLPIATEYGVSRSAIGLIKSGKRWGHLQHMYDQDRTNVFAGLYAVEPR